MFASVVTGQAHPDALEQGIEVWKGSGGNSKGFLGGYMIADRKTGKFMTFNLWEKEEDAHEYDLSGGFQQDIDRYAPGFETRPTREVFEVVAERHPEP